MLFHLPRLAREFGNQHKPALAAIGGQVITRFASALLYSLIPIMLAAQHGEWLAGVLFSLLSVLQAFGINPITAAISDRVGSRLPMLGGGVTAIASGLLWIFAPLENPVWLAVFFIFYAAQMSLRESINTYLLRTTDKNSGGLIFGLQANIFSTAYFFSTIAMTFFVASGDWQGAGLLMLLGGAVNLAWAWRLPNDLPKQKKSSAEPSWLRTLNPFATIGHGWHFVRQNSYFPVLALGNTCFQGFFYGTLWFVLPLHLAATTTGSVEDGLQLGIYELVTMLIAGLAGWLADRLNWRWMHTWGWLLVMAGAALMPFFSGAIGLIVLGAVIGIGDNLESFAGEHALEYYDIDHREDGSFSGLRSLIEDSGYAISPLVSGFLYAAYGFESTLAVLAIFCAVIGTSMIALTWKLRVRRRKTAG